MLKMVNYLIMIAAFLHNIELYFLCDRKMNFALFNFGKNKRAYSALSKQVTFSALLYRYL